ncbi:M23 family metallopeptidase [Yeosuana sp. MJ-SS3]|uniref:M23 family metallopeptidase n=1 Tax=Gilvirhabdus luticola TaxID=3079858 RepID=A0ABU3UA56_9FLAO|nr:M23 family metallopeptidase [Yeosuana sp. MJ-SS3]MDU8887278.1 M23 family metallopeptidase [Yeosuana sp. MJ-SS3]
MRLILFLFFLAPFLIGAQNVYPQDYFQNPLDGTLVLAGTFAELRPNHFHSGLDIKTQQRVGLNVYVCADGYVSRIKVSHFGYGKALYVTHPNGYTTVYCHLQKFAPEIEAYVKKQQYEKESYEIELFPNIQDLLLEKGEVIAYSGNSGGSTAPHLHFEIRDKAERPINPMLFGIDIQDTTRPVISSAYVYPANDSSYVNNSSQKQKLRLIPLANGDYSIENIEAYGKIGFGIVTNDRQDLASNKNGVSKIQSFYNGNQNFEIDFSVFSFSETKHLNRLIDYAEYKTNKKRIQKLFIEANNPLSMYKNVENNGFITVEDSTNTVYKVRVKDYKNNDAWLTVTITGLKDQDVKPYKKLTTPYYIYHDQAITLQEENVTVELFKDTFYDNFYLDFNVHNDTLTLGEDVIPLKKSFAINYDISNYAEEDKNKLYIAELVGYYKYPSYSKTKREGDKLSTLTKYLGTYALTLDTIAPTIRPINFQTKKWLSKYRFLKVKIDDKLSGISNYRATVNGKWILMEYDYKTKTLTHDFNDGIITDTENNLKIIVTDNVGNNSTFEAVFYRK